MSFKIRFATLAGTVVLALTPAAALAQGIEYAPEHPTHPAHPVPGPKAPLPEKAKAYGVYCRGFSKQHAQGEKGTPFSQCVTAMARAASGSSPRKACQGFSKDHVSGEKGTAFSRCVVAATQAKKVTAQG